MTANMIIYDKNPDTPDIGIPTIKVTIGHTMVEEILAKILTVITPPKSSAQFDISIGASQSKILDLLRSEHRYNVDGVIAVDLGTVSPESSVVATKKSDLKKLFNAGGVVYMIYEGNTISGNFEKLSITDKARDEDTVMSYDVKFTFLKGVNI
jgi:hypothetical protein